jgi:23S rRNA (cytidine1920-2'-O)/16S rRNA (cytidine1409-2'-O)-methyltransferase
VKIRLDQILVDRQLVPTRQKAQSMIMIGNVLVNGQVITKPGYRIHEQDNIEITQLPPFVSRGGEKLDPVLEQLGIAIENRICLDVGASTGGFTDVLLKRGAARVYAVDVGTNQLDYSLRSHDAVIVWEQTHAKDLHSGMFDPLPSFCVMDISFISVTTVLKPVIQVMAYPEFLILVKPQFEIGKDIRNFKGVVKEQADQWRAVEKVRLFCAHLGLVTKEVIPSPITGPKGNQEYFLWITE